MNDRDDIDSASALADQDVTPKSATFVSASITKQEGPLGLENSRVWLGKRWQSFNRGHAAGHAV
jgi:hypothetical protein